MPARPLSPELAKVFPHGSGLTEDGVLEIGGCDARSLAAEFGTPLYVYAEADMRHRAQTFHDAFRRQVDEYEIAFASKAFPCVAALRLFSGEGLSCDVASGGELFLALRAGVDPARIYFHGNNKTDAELAYATEAEVGYVVVDSAADIERLERRAPGQRVLLRVTPGIRPDTHAAISTGQQDSKFGIPVSRLEEVLASIRTLEVKGLHAHIGSQIFDLEPFEQLSATLAALGDYPLLNLGGGLGIAYHYSDDPPAIEEFVAALARNAPDRTKLVCEPGRSLVGNAGITLYSVGTVKDVPGRRYVAVDGGMSDNLRPMLYGATYEAEVAERPGGDTRCTVVGMHCESGDVLIRDAALADPQRGEVIAVPATGAYAYALANNYNAVPRPAVVFCDEGEARLVVRRETYEDLAMRDIETSPAAGGGSGGALRSSQLYDVSS